MIRNARRIGFAQTTSALSVVTKAMLIVVLRRRTVARRQGDVKNAMEMYIVNGGRNVSDTSVLHVKIMRNANLGT